MFNLYTRVTRTRESTSTGQPGGTAARPAPADRITPGEPEVTGPLL